MPRKHRIWILRFRINLTPYFIFVLSAVKLYRHSKRLWQRKITLIGAKGASGTNGLKDNWNIHKRLPYRTSPLMFWLNLLPHEGRKSSKGIVCIEKNRGEPSASVQQSDDSKAVFEEKFYQRKILMKRQNASAPQSRILQITTPMKMLSPVMIVYPMLLVMISRNPHFGRGERWIGNMKM